MALQEIVADPTPWEQRSYEELKDIVGRGFAAGQDFVAAAREMERRGRDCDREETIAETRRRHSARRYRLALVAALVAFAIAMAVALILAQYG